MLAKAAFRKGAVSRDQLKTALETFSREGGNLSLEKILLDQNALTKGQLDMIINELEQFKRSSIVDTTAIDLSNFDQSDLLKAVMYPQLKRYDVVEPLAEGGMGANLRSQ